MESTSFINSLFRIYDFHFYKKSYVYYHLQIKLILIQGVQCNNISVNVDLKKDDQIQLFLLFSTITALSILQIYNY